MHVIGYDMIVGLTTQSLYYITTTKASKRFCLYFSFILTRVFLQNHRVFVLARGFLQPRLEGLLVPVHLRLHFLQLLSLLENVILETSEAHNISKFSSVICFKYTLLKTEVTVITMINLR